MQWIKLFRCIIIKRFELKTPFAKTSGNLNARYIFYLYSLANPVARPQGISLAIHLA
jgi:hypothetical protein